MTERNDRLIEQAKERIRRNGGTVGIDTLRVDHPGLKVLAAIDCLCNYAGYRWVKPEQRADARPW